MPAKQKWNLSSVPTSAKRSVVDYLKAKEKLEFKNLAKLKLEYHRDHSFHPQLTSLRDGSDIIQVPIAEEAQKAIHVSLHAKKLELIEKELQEMQLGTQSQLQVAKQAIDKSIVEQQQETKLWYSMETNLMQDMEVDPDVDHSDIKIAATKQIILATQQIQYAASTKWEKWQQFEIDKVTRHNTRVQQAEVSKEILREEIQRGLSIEDQIANLRAQVQKSLILQDPQGQKGNQHRQPRSPRHQERAESRSNSKSRPTSNRRNKAKNDQGRRRRSSSKSKNKETLSQSQNISKGGKRGGSNKRRANHRNTSSHQSKKRRGSKEQKDGNNSGRKK